MLLLSISDFLNQIGDFILPPAAELEDKENVGPTCIVQAVWSSFFDLVVICWTVAIAATLWLSVFKRVSVHVLEKRFWIFHLVCYGFPLIVSTTCVGGFLHYPPTGSSSKRFIHGPWERMDLLEAGESCSCVRGASGGRAFRSQVLDYPRVQLVTICTVLYSSMGGHSVQQYCVLHGTSRTIHHW